MISISLLLFPGYFQLHDGNEEIRPKSRLNKRSNSPTFYTRQHCLSVGVALVTEKEEQNLEACFMFSKLSVLFQFPECYGKSIKLFQSWQTFDFEISFKDWKQCEIWKNKHVCVFHFWLRSNVHSVHEKLYSKNILMSFTFNHFPAPIKHLCLYHFQVRSK